GAGLAFAQSPVAPVERARVDTLPAMADMQSVRSVQPVASTPPAGPSGWADTGSNCPTPACSESRVIQTVVCAPRYRVWGSAEYLFWWIKDTPLPPLVTSSPPGTLPALGRPGTTVLFGGNDVDNEERSGGRFTLGMWLDACEHFGIEGS